MTDPSEFDIGWIDGRLVHSHGGHNPPTLARHFTQRRRDLFVTIVDRLCFAVVGASIVGCAWIACAAGWL